MKAFPFSLCLLAMSAGILNSASGQELFLESAWQNDTSTPGLAVWVGGNEPSSFPGPGNPYSTNGFYLLESAIGQVTAQNQAYPGAADQLSSLVLSDTQSGQTYLYPNGLGGPSTNSTWWQIIFPGGFRPDSGQTYGDSSTGQNFDTNYLNQAEYYLRTLLRIEPLNTNAAQQLVLLADARMRPLEWCGTAALVYAEKARLLGLTANGVNMETNSIGLAEGYFRSACDIFPQVLANPSDARLVEGQSQSLSLAVSNAVAVVLDDYLRNLAEYAHASLTGFQLRNLAQFYDPSHPQQSQGALPPATQVLLKDIDARVRDIQLRLLLASPFQGLPAYTLGSAGVVQNYLAQIGRMRESVLLGRITFIAGDDESNPTNAPLYDGEYTTSFVPIFAGLQNPGNSSFDIALHEALGFTSTAATLESAASSAMTAADNAGYQYTSEHQNLEQQYLTQLVNLCGYGSVDTNGDQVPDIFFAALPPGIREDTTSQYVTNGNFKLTQTGAIYQQWLAVQTAETNLVYAWLQLSNIMATMLIKAQLAYSTSSNDLQLAALDLAGGQQISAIDILEGEANAQGDLTSAQIQANLALKQAQNSIWGEEFKLVEAGLVAVASAVLTPATGGASIGLGGALLAGIEGAGQTALADAPALFTTLQNTYAQASAALAIGQAKANTDKALAQYQAEIQQVSASEQAALQYNNATNALLNLSADLNQLRLQAQAQSVQIQLAAQALDQERSKLSTEIGQVSYLLRQYARSFTLIDQNPALSTNLLLVRNADIQKADDAFVLAQQWAFLTAQTFAYKDNSPNSAGPTFVKSVLAARNTGDLLSVLNLLQSANTLLYTNAPNFRPVAFSLRNNFVQANQTATDGTNLVFLSYELTAGGTNAAASQADWANYLKGRISTDTNGDQVLTLDFATTLLRSEVGGSQRNPFWTPNTYGGLLFSGTDNGNLYKGVQVNLVTRGMILPQSAAAGFWVQLAQLGTSSVLSAGNAWRFFNFGPFMNQFTASANNLLSSPGTDAFSERSPANDHWQLLIDGGVYSPNFPGSMPNNQELLNNLDQLIDIQFVFAIKDYTY